MHRAPFVAIATLLTAMPAGGQPATDPIEALIDDFVAEAAVGLPDFIGATADACLVATINGLDGTAQEAMRAAPDFLDGVNAIAAANPELPETLFPALDACVGNINAGEVMWLWIEAEWADATVDQRIAAGSCLIGAVDRLALDAKRGIARFRRGDFADAISAMMFERPELAGTLIEDMAVCGVQIELTAPDQLLRGGSN
jgi:hypothetical protein